MKRKEVPLIGCVGHDCAACKKQKREMARQRKALKHLSDTVLLFLHRLDERIGPDKGIPSETSRAIALIANDLDVVNDGVRYSKLGVDYRKDNKADAVQKMIGAKP